MKQESNQYQSLYFVSSLFFVFRPPHQRRHQGCTEFQMNIEGKYVTEIRGIWAKFYTQDYNENTATQQRRES